MNSVPSFCMYTLCITILNVAKNCPPWVDPSSDGSTSESKRPTKSNQFTSSKWDTENTHWINIRDRNMWIPPSKPGSNFPDSNWKMVIVHTIVMTSSQHHCRCEIQWARGCGVQIILGVIEGWSSLQVSSVMWWLWWDEGRVLAHVKLPESDSWTSLVSSGHFWSLKQIEFDGRHNVTCSKITNKQFLIFTLSLD